MRETETAIHLDLVVTKIEVLQETRLDKHSTQKDGWGLKLAATLPKEVIAELELGQGLVLWDRVQQSVAKWSPQHVMI